MTMDKMGEHRGRKQPDITCNGPLIMVVDDEPNMCAALQRILETEGYRVITAADGKTALRLIPEVRPDLILLDIMMPGLHGQEVGVRARQLGDSRIVYFTARADLASAENSKTMFAEADALLTKPATSKRILSVVDATLGGHQH
jgi:CheY-like chemotaxis protein